MSDDERHTFVPIYEIENYACRVCGKLEEDPIHHSEAVMQ